MLVLVIFLIFSVTFSNMFISHLFEMYFLRNVFNNYLIFSIVTLWFIEITQIAPFDSAIFPFQPSKTFIIPVPVTPCYVWYLSSYRQSSLLLLIYLYSWFSWCLHAMLSAVQALLLVFIITFYLYHNYWSCFRYFMYSTSYYLAIVYCSITICVMITAL